SVPTPTSFTYELASTLTGLAASGSPWGLDSKGVYTPGYPASAAVETGELLVCYTGGLCHAQGGGSGTEGRKDGNVYRSQQHFVKIEAINGNEVTISPGLLMDNWATHGRTHANGRGPGAWTRGPVVYGDGIEDLTVIHTNSQ